MAAAEDDKCDIKDFTIAERKAFYSCSSRYEDLKDREELKELKQTLKGFNIKIGKNNANIERKEIEKEQKNEQIRTLIKTLSSLGKKNVQEHKKKTEELILTLQDQIMDIDKLIKTINEDNTELKLQYDKDTEYKKLLSDTICERNIKYVKDTTNDDSLAGQAFKLKMNTLADKYKMASTDTERKKICNEALTKDFTGYNKVNEDPLIYATIYCFSSQDPRFCIDIGIDITNLCFVIHRWGAWRRFDPVRYVIELDLNQTYKGHNILIERLKDAELAAEFINYYNALTLKGDRKKVLLHSNNYKKLYYKIQIKTFFTESIDDRNQPNSDEYGNCYPVYIDNPDNLFAYKNFLEKSGQIAAKAQTDLKKIYSIIRKGTTCTITDGNEHNSDSFEKGTKFTITKLNNIEENPLPLFTVFTNEYSCNKEYPIPFSKTAKNSICEFATGCFDFS